MAGRTISETTEENEEDEEQQTRNNFSKDDLELASVSVDPTLFEESCLELGPFRLYALQAIHLAIVLEDLCDQLDVLGRSLPTTQIELRSQKSVVYDDTNHRATWRPDAMDAMSENKGYSLEQHYASILPRRIYESHYLMPRPRCDRKLLLLLKESGLKQDTVPGKIQADRAFLQWAVQAVIDDLIRNRSFDSLNKVVQSEREKRDILFGMFKKMKDDAELIKQLKVDIKVMKKQKIRENKLLDAQIFEVKDHLLEMNIRKPMEHVYTQNIGKAMIQGVKKKNLKVEKDFARQLKHAKLAVGKEDTAHESMKQIINQNIQRSKSLLEYWMEKFEKDTVRLQQELDELKTYRAKALSRIAWLRKMIANYEEIVVDDRRVKKIHADRVTKHEFEMKASTKVQSWWRGLMVRELMGPFKNLYIDLKARKKSISKKGK